MECNIQRQALEVWITLHIREQVHIGSQDIYFQELGLLATNNTIIILKISFSVVVPIWSKWK